jgi:hypothetical protein
MEKETVKRIFYFLEGKDGIRSLLWKLFHNEPLKEADLYVKGDLRLKHEKRLKALPDGLKVGGDLDLSFTKITSLPEDLEVGGDLNISSCKNLTSLPEGLKVDGGLTLSQSGIESLPQGLNLGGYLSIGYTLIKSLPEGLTVGGNLYIDNNPLKKYSDKELREIIKPGYIKGRIIR